MVSSGLRRPGAAGACLACGAATELLGWQKSQIGKGQLGLGVCCFPLDHEQ